MVVSKFRETQEGKWYLEVDRKPFLYNSLEAYLGEKENLNMVFSCCANAGYQLLSIWLSWREIESEEGIYDFTALQKILDLACEYNLRIEIVWGGTNFCDKLDRRLVPDWVLNYKQYIFHNKAGKPIYVPGNDMGFCCVVNAKSRKLLSLEKSVLLSIIGYIKENDKTHRVILLRLANDINANGYASEKKVTLRYLNSLARCLNETDYKIASTLTVSNWHHEEFDKDVDALLSVNAQGISTFVPKVSFTKKVLTDGIATKFKFISSNAAYDNTTAHIVTALCCGGFYCIYRLSDDLLWDRPGVYDAEYNIKQITTKLRDFNLSLAKINNAITTASEDCMVGFNIENDGMPDMYYRKTKNLKNLKVGFLTRCNSSVGLGVYSDNCYYFTTDSQGTFFFDNQMICEAGYFDENNTWITTQKRSAMIYDAMFYYNCEYRECLRIMFLD